MFRSIFSVVSSLWSYDSKNRTAVASSLIWLITLTLVFFFAWAWSADVDRVVSGIGKVVPREKLQTVEHFEGGRVESIAVKSGDLVSKGAILMTLSPLLTVGEYNIAKERVARLAIDMARLQAEYGGRGDFRVPPGLRTEYPSLYENARLLFDDRLSRVREEINAFNAQIVSARAQVTAAAESVMAAEDEYQTTRQLVDRGLEAALTLTRAKKALADARAAEVSARQEVAGLIARKASRLREEAAEVADRLLSVRAEYAKAKEEIAVSADRAERSQIKSPINGFVNRVLVTTLGGTVQSGEPLVEIVPADSPLIVETRISPADIGFVRLGQKALVKFSAYDFSIFGHLDGRISVIGSDSVADETGAAYFPVQIELSSSVLRSKNGEFKIISGMETQIDVVTGKRSVFDYVFSPFTRLTETSFREK